MERIFNYKTVTEALKILQEKGYTIDYNLQFDYLETHVEHFEIDYLYRYEGLTDPADESTVYGISNQDNNEKGVFVAGNLSFIEGKKQAIILALELKGHK